MCQVISRNMTFVDVLNLRRFISIANALAVIKLSPFGRGVFFVV